MSEKKRYKNLKRLNNLSIFLEHIDIIIDRLNNYIIYK